jgi:hypothetical protein
MAAATLAAATTLVPAGPPQFIEPIDGATVKIPLVVRFRVPEAEPAAGAMKGMHGMSGDPDVHLIIDSPLPEPGAMVPADGRHRHLLRGERQTMLQLTPGAHTLQLVLAGANHRVGTPPIASDKITVHVPTKSNMPAPTTKTSP